MSEKLKPGQPRDEQTNINTNTDEAKHVSNPYRRKFLKLGLVGLGVFMMGKGCGRFLTYDSDNEHEAKSIAEKVAPHHNEKEVMNAEHTLTQVQECKIITPHDIEQARKIEEDDKKYRVVYNQEMQKLKESSKPELRKNAIIGLSGFGLAYSAAKIVNLFSQK